MNRPALLALTAVAAALLLAPATALAGGWATVGMSSLPDDTRPGEPWVVDLTVLQHGRTPLEGVTPAVLIRQSGRPEQRFAARPTDKPGVYRARVTFPAGGEWTYLVDDDFTAVHQMGTVTFGGSDSAPAAPEPAKAPAAPAAAPAADAGGVSVLGALGSALAGGLLAALAAVALRRRIDARPAAG